MSNFLEAVLASLAGVSLFYLIEAIYYDVKARINGRRFVQFVEDLEDDTWDN